VTLHLPGGTIQVSITNIETFAFDETTGVTTITEAWDGAVTGGKGLYRGAAGTLTADGTVVFNPDGTGSVDIEITVALT